METLNIGQLVWHPMSIDIIELKVIKIIQNESGTIEYLLKSTKGVGACGVIQVLVNQTKFGYLLCSELYEADDDEYVDGLGDFVEGKYYSNKSEARLEYYQSIVYSMENNMESKFKIYEEAKVAYEKVQKIIDEIKKEI